MKINSLLVETSAGATGSGSVASVDSPVGKMQKRAGSMFKGKKTNKPFYENKECDCPTDKCTCDESEVKEGAMPQSVIKVKEKIRMASDEENKKRFEGMSKEQIASMARRHGYKDKNPYAKFHDGKTGITEGSISNALIAIEAKLSEEDLILMPGQGIKFKRELMPKKTDHEVEMARGQLYQSAKNAKDICGMLQGVSEIQGIDAWVQSKITTAADYLETVRAYLESKYEMQQEVARTPVQTSMYEAESNINMDKWMKTYSRREDNNFHTENVVALAKLVGDERDIKLAKMILKDHMRSGSISRDDYDARQALDKKLWPLALRKYEEWKLSSEAIEEELSEFTEAVTCPECGGAAYDDEMIAEEKDACYSKVKSRYKVWPSAYASGALVRCRKVGAKNWGNKSKK